MTSSLLGNQAEPRSYGRGFPTPNFYRILCGRPPLSPDVPYHDAQEVSLLYAKVNEGFI